VARVAHIEPELSPLVAGALQLGARRRDLWTLATSELEANEFICQHIPSAQIAVLDAAHIANIEQPQVYADTVLKFLFKN